MTCKRCYSHAINHHCHGRDGSDKDLCDVCFWRKRAEAATGAKALTRQQALALHTMLDHYGGDQRTRCLVDLLPDNLRRDFGA